MVTREDRAGLQLMPSLLSFSQSHFHKLAAGPMDSQGILRGFLCLEILHFCQIFTSELRAGTAVPNGRRHAAFVTSPGFLLSKPPSAPGSPGSKAFISSAETKSTPSHSNYGLHTKAECDTAIWINLPPQV